MSAARSAAPVLAGIAVAAISITLLVAVLGAGDETAFVDLAVGDCFDLPRPDGAETIDLLAVELVDCDEPHDVEVVAVGELRDGSGPEDYPGLAAVDAEAAAACATVPMGRDDVGTVPVAPTEDTWNAFDGRFVCLAVGAGPLVGSVLEGSQLDG